MAATVGAWGKPGAWALDAEENEAELLQQHKEDSSELNDKSSGGETGDFPSLAAAATTKTKKKKPQTLSLQEFSAHKPAPKGLTPDELFALPTGPRERSAEELDRNKLGGGFRSYGGGRDEQPRRQGSFNRDSNREFTSSRADENDDWGAGKKSSGSDGFDRKERGEKGGFFGDSQSRSDEGRCMALFQATSDVPEQGAVDDRDTFLHGVRDLLSIYSNAQAGLSTYVSVPGIVQQLSNLHSELMTLQSDLEYALPEDRNRCINDLCTLVQSLQQLLFASSTTAQPILTPWTLMKELDEMEKVNAKLSTAVEDVTLEHCKKNEIVKHHSQEMALQRRVFVDFFCNPERLRNQVKELTARVRALQAS